MRVRPAGPADAAACAAIYAHYVTETAATFETEPPGPDEFARRMEAAHAWFVAEDDDRVVGFAYAGPHHPRPAYAWSADVAVYVDVDRHRAGIGRALYEPLLDAMRARGLRMAFAVIAQPNPASNGLHERMGFTEAGVLRTAGWKLGAWRDVRWMELDLDPGREGPPPGA